MSVTGSGVAVVVPVKRLAFAKSRLGVEPAVRRDLALGFALDTVAALAGCPDVGGVLVVTSDPLVARCVRRRRVRVVAEEGVGLAVAVGTGLAAARREGAERVAVVPGDLPCLTPSDVGAVLAAAADAGAYVPDRDGAGTTFVVGAPGVEPPTCYGPGSAGLHLARGLRPLADAPVRARHDVDTLDDLVAALALGTGEATLGALEAGGLWPDPLAG